MRERGIVEITNESHPENPDTQNLAPAIINLYFSEVVIHHKVTPSHARKPLVALQWYIKNLLPVEKRFDAESEQVKECLQVQKIAYENGARRDTLPDPHSGLRIKILSHDENLKVLHHIFKHSRQWGCLSLSWNWGMRAYVRCDSIRKMCLADLVVSKALGPEKQGPLSRIMCMVLRKGDVHKDRFTLDRVVGCWRARDYIGCPVFAVSLHLLWKLHVEPDLVDFMWVDRSRPAKWHKVPLIEWATYNQAYNAAKKVLNDCCVAPNKVTHLRTVGMEIGGNMGLSPSEAASMSKHVVDKWTRYAPEISARTCHVMAGFELSESYYVPRAQLELPHPLESILLDILPRLPMWREQHLREGGDNSTAAENFLSDTIPYIVEVVVQDGIFFIRDFPDHPMSQLLKNRIQGYQTWARNARREVKVREESVQVDKVRHLNDATRAAFTSMESTVADLHKNLHREMMGSFASTLRAYDAQESKVEALSSKILDVDRKLDEIKGLIVQGGAQRNAAVPPTTLFLQHTPLPHQGPQRRLLLPALPERSDPRQITPNNGVQAHRRGTVNTVLRPTPAAPALTPLEHKTPSQILREHETLDLERWRDLNKKHWAKGNPMNYSRRLYIHTRITERARFIRGAYSTHKEKMEAAAEAMTNEMKDKGYKSLYPYIKWLKANDESTPKRKKRRTTRAQAPGVQGSHPRNRTAAPADDDGSYHPSDEGEDDGSSNASGDDDETDVEAAV